jgi:type IV pilus assembly protein PilM
MAERVLGLDVGTSHVRVVEVVLSSPPVVSRVGEVPLPAGAVRDGEVLDPAAVGAAIQDLWRQTGLRARDVRVGLTGSRVVVRVVDLPAMPEEELAGAVRFSASDHIPIPLEEAVLDQTVLEAVPAAEPGGQEQIRVLIAAAHRSTLDALLAAVAAGGLRTTAVDLVPFALVRALRPPAEPAAEPLIDGYSTSAASPPEAIVSVGAGLTTVIVHEDGRPRFVRTVAVGADMLTAAISEELGVSPEAAETTKRAVNAGPGGGGDGDDLTRRAARVVELRLSSILGEIQSSLAYWMTSSDRHLGRVVLVGGGTRAGDVAGRLALLVGTTVETGAVVPLAAPEAALGVGDWTDLVVAAGLALGGAPRAGARINFCPPQRRRLRFDRELARRAGVAAAVLAVLLGGLSARSVLALRHAQADLSTQEHVNGKIQAEMARYAPLQKLNTDLTTSRKRVAAALAGDIAWPKFLSDFIRSMPDNVWIQSLSVTASPKTAAATSPAAGSAAGSAAAPPTVGSLQVAVTGIDYPSVAAWLEKVAADPALSGLTISGITKADTGGHPLVTFGSTATLTPAARSDRAGQLTKAAQ